MKSNWKPHPLIFRVIILSLAAYCFLTSVKAQTDDPPDASPPPMVSVPKDERKQLETEKDMKKRTELSLDLLETHLVKAEQLTGQSEFQTSLNELGSFHGILENCLNYLNSHDDGSGKIKSNFKRLEIGLRKFIPRLEILRRGMPFNYGFHVLKLQKAVRDARSRALDPLLDDSVVPQNKP